MKIKTNCTKIIVIFKENYSTVGEFTFLKNCFYHVQTHNIDLKYAKLSFCKVSTNSGPDSKKGFLVSPDISETN